MYEEHPSAVVAGAVVWTGRSEAPSRVLPDGCMDLLWDGAELRIAGPDTEAFLSDSPGTTVHGLRFAPGDAPEVLGLPAHEVAGRRVAIEDLRPAAEARRLTERLAEQIAVTADAGAALESLARHLRRERTADPGEARLIRAVAGHMADDRPVEWTATEVGLSERQLHRRSLVAFGYGPKTLAAILRMQRAVGLAREGTPFAAAAAGAGYTDQSHLARHVKRFAGVPLGDLLAGR